jgi:hypothetical protein
MQPLDGIAAHRLRDASQSLRVRHLIQSNARKLAIAQVQAHFTLQRVEAPVADMLEQQQPQRRFGSSLRASARSTVGVPPALSIKHGIYQFLVLQQPVGFYHPRLPQRADIHVHHTFPQ